MRTTSAVVWLGLAVAVGAAPLACGGEVTIFGGSPGGGAAGAGGGASGGSSAGGASTGGGATGGTATGGASPGGETECADGLDDDGDGLVDCADPDCDAAPVCQGPVEICTNGLDDDGDGLADCADPDCASEPACGGAWICAQILTCSQGCGPDLACIDGCKAAGCASAQAAFDGLQQCLIDHCLAECIGDPGGPTCQGCMATSCSAMVDACLADGCQGPVELACDNGLDDDGDGLVDCADADCVFHPSCQGQVETACENGLDDDGDGPVDCADSDCVGSPACGGALWRCSQILVCTQSCSGDFACIAACKANGCPTAQAAFQDVQNCLMTHCLAPCASDPGSPTCQSCMSGSCGSETSACLANTCQGGGVEGDCANAWDDDADGLVDCADSDCVADPVCQGQVETHCTDGLDDDGDGLVDCADADCAADQACVGVGPTCSEVLTCAQGCAGDLGCSMACEAAGCPTAQALYGDVESCLVNQCLVECVGDAGSPACQACMVAACAAELGACVADACQGVGTETACADSLDNDGDGAADCADTDCFADPVCAGLVETACDNGQDDDGDGPVDCADSDCAGDPVCGPGTTCGEVLVCTQGCGFSLGCFLGCRNDGCPSAQAAWGDVQSCMLGTCLLTCVLGPGSPDCQTCMAANCTSQLAACITDDCT